MTVKQLKDFLEQYSEDLEVKIGFHRQLGSINYASHGVDMDTNEVSVWLCCVEGSAKNDI